MTTKKNNNYLTIINFQSSALSFTKCKDCTREECELVYDHHHDQHFGLNCGTVIMQSNSYLIDYYSDPLYWEKEYTRRRELKQLKRIYNELKELKLKKLEVNTEELTIQIKDQIDETTIYLINKRCRDTDFTIKEDKPYYIIKKEIQKK